MLDVDQSVDEIVQGYVDRMTLESPSRVLHRTSLVKPVAGGWQLITAALVGIALIVVLITLLKLHPFIALILGALTVGIVAGEDVNDVLASFTTGFGTTAAGVGALIALGAMFAKLLADSGGADQIVDTIVGNAPPAGCCRGRWPGSAR